MGSLLRVKVVLLLDGQENVRFLSSYFAAFLWFVRRGYLKAKEELTALRKLKSSDLDEAPSSRLEKPLQVIFEKS